MTAEINTAAIDALVEAELKPDGPGCAVAAVRDGVVVHRKGYGLANVEWKIPNTPDTVFRLASISKQFTAVAIMLLAEQGKLSVDDLLTQYLPDYPTSGHDITIHHLLTHTSGIRSYTSMESFQNEISRKDLTTQQLCDIFKKEPFDFRPGARFLYNNSGYFLLGMIIEKISGMSYADFVTKNLFEPLGMKQSYYLHNEPIVPKRASGYVLTENGFMNAPFLSMHLPYAAGALGSTADDLVRWDRGLRENRLLRQETLTKMHQPTALNDGSKESYAYGWMVGDYRGHKMFHHAGGINGFGTNMIHFPDDSACVIVLSNYNGFDHEKVMLGVARQILGLPEITREAITLGDAKLDLLAGSYQLENFPGQMPIVKSDGKLTLSILRTVAFAPYSETAFYQTDNAENELRFETAEDGAVKVTLATPLMTIHGRRVGDVPA